MESNVLIENKLPMERSQLYSNTLVVRERLRQSCPKAQIELTSSVEIGKYIPKRVVDTGSRIFHFTEQDNSSKDSSLLCVWICRWAGPNPSCHPDLEISDTLNRDSMKTTLNIKSNPNQGE